MRKSVETIALLMLSSAMAVSCEGLFSSGEKGALSISFDRSQFSTRAVAELPDTNEFRLSVKDAKGNGVFEGKFGDLPEQLIVRSGTYDISVRSGVMEKPAFSSPVYGDDQCVIVPEGGVEQVRLVCSQVNSGVRLKVAPDFLTSYPEGLLFLKSGAGKLLYAYREQRIASFNPGEVSLMLDDGGKQSSLMTRSLAPREVLTIGVSAPAPGGDGSGVGDIVISIDTSRVWTGADVIIGEGDAGDGRNSAMDVHTARANIGKTGVWVYGYVCGAFKSTSSVRTEEPFQSATNCAIGSRKTTDELGSMLSVELKKGELRDEVNLVDNPENLGRIIYLKGDLVEAYYGIPGIKNVTDYLIE